MNKYLFFLGYQGPKTLFLLILFMLYWQGQTNPYIYLAVIGWQTINYFINVAIKNIIKAPRPDSHKDPQFLHLNPTISNFLTVHRQFGMPSGHAQDVVKDLVFLALYFENPAVTVLAAMQTLLTLWHRYKERRHTLKQLAVGSAVGVLMGGILFLGVNPPLSKHAPLGVNPQTPLVASPPLRKQTPLLGSMEAEMLMETTL